MNASIVKLFNELKSEIQSLRAELAALKVEKNQSNQPVSSNLSGLKDLTGLNPPNPPKPAACIQGRVLSENERVIRLPEVLKIIGLSRSAIYARIKKGLFPKQIKLGERAAGWFQSEINAFVQSLAVVGGVA